jgi:hypothetical protein
VLRDFDLAGTDMIALVVSGRQNKQIANGLACNAVLIWPTMLEGLCPRRP